MSRLKTHPNFDYPENPSTNLWRYMDFTKFIAVLEDSSLFMSRVDRLKDTFEGVITQFDLLNREKLYDKGMVDILSKVDSLNNMQRQRSYVNCWHINDFESAAMWSLYLKSNEGIAIKTNFQSLSDSIVDEKSVWIGNVYYIDYNTYPTPRNNMFSPMFMKRKRFEHEHEIRVFYGENANIWFAEKNTPNKPMYEQGFNLKVDLNTLIHEIYVSPESPLWLYDLVIKIKDKYSIRAPVIKSDLYSSPLI